MSNNTASQLIRRFKLIQRDEHDYRCDHVLLDGFIATCEHFAVDSFKLDRRSYDSPRCYLFADGSALRLGNPSQITYPAAVSEMGTATMHSFSSVKEGRFL